MDIGVDMSADIWTRTRDPSAKTLCLQGGAEAPELPPEGVAVLTVVLVAEIGLRLLRLEPGFGAVFIELVNCLFHLDELGVDGRRV